MKGVRATVMGGARSGLAAARLLRRAGADVFVSETGELPPTARRVLEQAGATYETGGHTPRALQADCLVLSPGVPTDSPVVSQALRQGLPVLSETELAFRFCAAPIVAVTGTNGKTTVTSLIGDIFERAGRRAVVAGNIGRPLSDVVHAVRQTDIVVLEVSSFQLDHIHGFRPAVSVLLNVTPDHLDRYGGDFGLYAQSKFRVFENQRDADVLVHNLDDPCIRRRLMARPPVRTAAFSCWEKPENGAWLRGDSLVLHARGREETLLSAAELALRGRHNVYNSLAAAVAAHAMGTESNAIAESLRRFEGVPHRLEFVRELRGVRYVNDSKATNVQALRCALESFDEDIVLIAGGRDKGNDWSAMRRDVSEKVRAMVTFGESADTLLEELGAHSPRAARAVTLEEATHMAQSMARPGDVVLLSPACASFDQFVNYEHRGDAFKRFVRNL